MGLWGWVGVYEVRLSQWGWVGVYEVSLGLWGLWGWVAAYRVGLGPRHWVGAVELGPIGMEQVMLGPIQVNGSYMARWGLGGVCGVRLGPIGWGLQGWVGAYRVRLGLWGWVGAYGVRLGPVVLGWGL